MQHPSCVGPNLGIPTYDWLCRTVTATPPPPARLLATVPRPKGATIRYGGGGWICFLVIFGDFMREIKSFIFSPQNRLEIFISIFILYLFQRPLWITYLFPPCFVANYLFHPILLKQRVVVVVVVVVAISF